MPWQLVATQPAPAFPSEEWGRMPLVEVEDASLYAFRVNVPDGLPQSWNTIGYWGLAQNLDGQLVLGQTFPIPLVPESGQTGLIALWPNLVNFVVEPPLDLVVCVSVHKWIVRASIELYARI